MGMTTAQALAVKQIQTMRARHMLRGADIHVSADRTLKRKRIQPRGSRPCLGSCGRLISANKSACAACAEAAHA